MVWRVEEGVTEILFKGTYVAEYLYDFLISMEEEKNYVFRKKYDEVER